VRRIAIINQKGGAGKTTTTVSLGAALAERDKRVLIIDLDPQYSATTWLAVHPVGQGVFDLFAETERSQLKDLIQATTTANLSLVGSSAWLVGAEKALANEPGAETILRDKLATVENEFDYVLIDCPPTLGVLSINALTAVNEVLVPVAAQVMNLHGIAQLHQTIELVKKRLNPQLHFAGILACRLDQRTNHGPEIVLKLRERFPETLRTTIRENVKLAECPSMGEPITSYAPTSAGAEDYRALADELMQQEQQEEGGEYAKAANI
jgi:chromosome partitioning protein